MKPYLFDFKQFPKPLKFLHLIIKSRFLVLFILSFIVSSLHSEERRIFSYYIEWQNVPGAKGYMIQIKDRAANTEREEKLVQNNIELKVPSGYYEYRIASINKFGKPSSWTKWEEFYVEKDKPKPLKKDEKQVAQEVVEVEPKRNFQKWKWFIPGWTQLENNQKIKGSLWILWFTGLALYGNMERLAGNRIASDPMNDPIYLSAISIGLKTPLLGDIYLRERRNDAESEYNRHQTNQVAVGVVAILSYALQVWQARKISTSNVTIELNQRSESFGQRVYQAENSMYSFEMKFSMSY
ncbi:MAG TPA: fibronectin type III domain-containing protein [Leptospiraceae bacterium]|nr:fibronectin type III domain-containing protein [Leptospiraceae bacterium]HMW05961.1 fibronectin type III domain-containing protein [Leptospiraceae bacterium]HMZ62483.1 fibronectin type III domain-containing protein [Leptospiraceae bacterium]HNA05715.1 fibronectin type III domain-containing protein [Leptospiraceae bacterium]HNB99726.1 fibronectin type III domain-containing protein [Leptospiraceae bacterium]